MKNEELLNELHGKVAGESRAATQQVLSTPKFDDDVYNPTKLMQKLCIYRKRDIKRLEKLNTHKVIAKHNDYAIIKKWHYVMDTCGYCGLKHKLWERTRQTTRERRLSRYYLTGLNDDDKLYFLHPLFNLPETLLDWSIELFRRKIDVSAVVDWVERKDEGFDGRIQGDILYRIIRLDDIVFIPEGSPSVPIAAELKKIKEHREEALRIEREVFNISSRYRERALESFQGFFQMVNTSTLSPNYEIRIGNSHTVKVDKTQAFKSGIYRSNTTRNMWFVMADQVILEHPEHITVTKKIPENSIMVLTLQRGTADGGRDD